MTRDKITGYTFDQERALYALNHTDVENCRFEGPADGESALKEARNIRLADCHFSLRYPLWHVRGFNLERVSMDEKARAAMWYCDQGIIEDSTLHGIKALRECSQIALNRCDIVSPEFGWKCHGITMEHSSVTAEYLFFDSSSVKLDHVRMKGKEDLTIRDSCLDTKDAFWHSKNVTVINSTVKGEYLAWFSEGLTMINCRIIGTQPLCYCKNLKLVDCTMEAADLAFEYSDVEATVKGHIDSVKNIRSGCVTADSVGEVISGDAVMECTGQVIIR